MREQLVKKRGWETTSRAKAIQGQMIPGTRSILPNGSRVQSEDIVVHMTMGVFSESHELLFWLSSLWK